MITTETKIKDPKALTVLAALGALFSHVMHRLFVDRHIKKLPLNDLKTSYQKMFGISARHFNSLRYEIDGRVEANAKLLQLNIANKISQIKANEQKIKKLEKKKSVLKGQHKALQSYKHAVAAWRKAGRTKKKPKLSKALQKLNLNLCAIAAEIAKVSSIIHQKKRRGKALLVKSKKLTKRIDKPSICFGSKKRFLKQFNLTENSFESHEAWLNDWRFARNKQSYFLGSSDESYCNQNCQYDPIKRTLQIRLPVALEKEFGPYLVLEGVIFPYRGKDLESALFSTETRVNKKGRAVKDVKAVSYRFLQRKGEETAYYCQASFEETAPAVTSSSLVGAIGIDLNADHIAVCESDRFGNPTDAGSLRFSIEGTSSNHLKTVFGDHIALIVKRAKESGKIIVCESLDFTKKKASLREQGSRNYRRMLSSFAYQKFFDMLHARAKRESVYVKKVNPAYTSLIGYLKFRGYKSYTSHELAALAIARRGIGFSERPKTKNALSGTVSIQGLDDAPCFFRESGVRHVWSFYARQKTKIRAHMRESSTKGKWGRLIFHPQHPSGFAATKKDEPHYFPPLKGEFKARHHGSNESPAFLQRRQAAGAPSFSD